MISIAAVVATHNRPELLAERALASIAAQTRRPDYLVVVDDSDADTRHANVEIVASLTIPDARALPGELPDTGCFRGLEHCSFPPARD